MRNLPHARSRRRAFSLIGLATLMLGVSAAAATTPGAAVSASADVRPDQPRTRAGGFGVFARFFNETNRTLTLKAAHLDAGCWIQFPPQQVPPHNDIAWMANNCPGNSIADGYVTYTVDGTGGQGYAFMTWHYPGHEIFGGQAGGLYTLVIERQPTGPENAAAYFRLRCLIPTC